MALKTEAQMRQLRADSVKESSIERHFLKRAREYDCMQRKLMPFYVEDGWPDRVLIWPDGQGTTDWIELKRPKGGKYSQRQLTIMDNLRTCGCNVEGLHTKIQVDDYFDTRSIQLGVKRRKPGRKTGLAKLKQLQDSS